jgi:hypothetical protein
MIAFNETHYILGVWFVPHAPSLPVPERVDWMATAWREPDDPAWYVAGRFCRHVSEDMSAQAPLDEKQWFREVLPGTLSEEAALERMDAMAIEVSSHLHSPVETLRVQGDVVRLAAAMQAREWSHRQELPPARPRKPRRGGRRRPRRR